MDDSNDAAPPASSADLAAGSLPPPNPNVADDAPSGEVAAADPTSTPNTSAPPPNDSDASSSVKPSVPEASSLARPMSPTSPAAAPDPSPSYTMIYPLRSLLSDIQPSDPNDPQNKPQTRTAPVFPHVMPTPSLATASMADPFKSRFSYESPIVPTLNRSSSISQRRTAQWQANMSDKSGKASSPSSPDVRDIALASPLVSPTTTGNPLGHLFNTTLVSTPGTRARRGTVGSLDPSQDPNASAPPVPAASASVTPSSRTPAQSVAELEEESHQPEHQLTKSNVKLKAAQENADEEREKAAAAPVESQAAPTAVAVIATEPSGEPSAAEANADESTMLISPATAAPPLASLAPFRPSSSVTGTATNSTSNPTAENTNSSDVGSAFAAGGYVRLGPVRSDVEDASVSGSGSKPKRDKSRDGEKLRRRRNLANATATDESASTSASAPGSGPGSIRKKSKGTRKNQLAASQLGLLSTSTSQDDSEVASTPNSISSSDAVPMSSFPLHMQSQRQARPHSTSTTGSGSGAAGPGADEDSTFASSLSSSYPQADDEDVQAFSRSVEALAADLATDAVGEGSDSESGANSLDDDDLEMDEDDEDDADDERRRSGSGSRMAGTDRDSGMDASMSGTSGSSSGMFGYHKTARFQHVETENGHHILLGREGVLERCEDEPIHIPGAVQGFGVLIALEEDLNGNLVVRVVSENCTEILGLSPSYLFNLECFTHTLTQMQADNLWDNIQYLSDPANPETTADGNADEAPQVFLLSGYGQPGSAVIPGSGETSSGGEDASSSGRSAAGGRPGSIASSTSSAERRQWSCWCAAHRPKMIPPPPVGPPSMSPSSSSNSGTANPNPGGEPTPAGSPPDEQHFPQALIILELELEHDMYNPLYPPPPELLAPSGNASPGSGTRSSMSVNSGGSGSGATPVQGSIPPGGRTSDGSDRTIMPSSVTPPASRSGASVGADSPSGVTGGDAAMTSSNDMRSTLQSVDENSTNMTTITPTTAMPASSSANTSASIDSGLARPTPSTTSSGESITPRPPASITPTASNPTGADPKDLHIGGPGDQGEDESTWGPTAEQILASTTSRAQPIRALERMRQAERTAQQRRLASLRRGGSGGSGGSGRRGGAGGRGGRHQHRSGRLAYGGSGSLDVFSVLGQVNEQLSAANDLQTFLDVVVGLMKDLTQFHRVLIYQFDEIANGQVVAELVDYTKTKDLYRGLHFPAADIPPQARELYKINKVRSLYDRDQTTARLVGRTKADVELPLDLTHSYLRAMSPIHLKYLGNMGVRSSMSISIVSFGQLWGLICCHSYGDFGMRVSFPVRQMLRLLSDSISRNIERLSYAHRLHTRKLINTIPTEAHPTGHIVSNAEDLLGLFDADFGVLVIGEGAKILGPNENGQEIYLIAEYLRVKQFKIMQATQDIRKDFPDVDKLENQTQTSALNAIAGVLYVPLSAGGKDFIALLRKGQLREVTWAGRANKGADGQAALEPRASFKAWSEIISSRSRAWTDEQLETAGVLALVYGKFIDVWRQKETAVKATQLTNLLLSNASHEVRTPLNHIINYLELAMNGPLDKETRENLSMSHAASKNLLFTINDLLDLTRLEQGNETSLNEPFDLSFAIEDSIEVYRTEAERRNIRFSVITDNLPRMVIGDSKKIRTIVANLTANAVKFTEEGEIHVEARLYPEPPGLRDPSQIVIEVIVRDTGRGIEGPKLEGIFRDLEQIEHAEKSDKEPQTTGLGLGLAVVAHIIGQLSGQLRVDSKPGVGSQFVFLVPFNLPTTRSIQSSTSSRALSLSSNSGVASAGSRGSRHDVSRGHDEIDSLVEALNSSPSANMSPAERWNSQTSLVSDPRVDPTTAKATARSTKPLDQRPVSEGEVELSDSNFPLRSVRVDAVDVEVAAGKPPITSAGSPKLANPKPTLQLRPSPQRPPSFVVEKPSFHVLIVEDDVVNRNVLAKRLKMDGHQVSTSVNGQEAVDLIKQDRAFDCVLMDIQMPILDGFGAAEQIREIEKANPLPLDSVRPSTDLNSGIPIVAVSASLKESQRQFMLDKGMDAWILKPINFKRLGVLLRGCIDTEQRKKDLYRPGGDWEHGGWMREPVGTIPMGDITSPTSEAGPSK